MKSTAHQARSGYLIYAVIVFVFIIIGLIVWTYFDKKIKGKTRREGADTLVAAISPIKEIHQTNHTVNCETFAHFSTKPTSAT